VWLALGFGIVKAFPESGTTDDDDGDNTGIILQALAQADNKQGRISQKLSVVYVEKELRLVTYA
jgi:hypothetical protein